MLFGVVKKSKTFCLFSPSALCAKGVLFVFLSVSFLPIFRAFIETILFIKMYGGVFLIN